MVPFMREPILGMVLAEGALEPSREICTPEKLRFSGGTGEGVLVLPES
jgi:hypothetical protein